MDAPARARARGLRRLTADPGSDVPQVCINTPVTGCTADTRRKTCDPVCQVGCRLPGEVLGEHRRRAHLQRAARAAGRRASVRAAIRPPSARRRRRTTACRASSACRTPAAPRCYHFCKTDADCPMSTCTRDRGRRREGVRRPVGDLQPRQERGMPIGLHRRRAGLLLSPNGSDRRSATARAPARRTRSARSRATASPASSASTSGHGQRHLSARVQPRSGRHRLPGRDVHRDQGQQEVRVLQQLERAAVSS